MKNHQKITKNIFFVRNIFFSKIDPMMHTFPRSISKKIWISISSNIWIDPYLDVDRSISRYGSIHKNNLRGREDSIHQQTAGNDQKYRNVFGHNRI